MLSHLFKIIWNKKKENFLLISEMFFSFLVIFGVFSLMVYYWFNYKKPMGFEYEDVWVVNYMSPEISSGTDSVRLYYDNLKNSLISFPEVKDLAYTQSNVPFSWNTFNNNVRYRDKDVMANMFTATENYPAIFDLKMISGRWYNYSDRAARQRQVVLNQQLKEILFGNEKAEGKELTVGDKRYNIIGVAENMKINGSYQNYEPGIFYAPDTTELAWTSTILLKVDPSADAGFEGKLFKTLAKQINTSIEIEHLSKKLKAKNNLMQVPLIISIIVAGFLVFNVALGLFGVLWYNINKRRGEIGLRRAVGAPAGSIFGQLLGETLVLSTISLLVGSFFAFQFPLLSIFDLDPVIYITAIVLSALFIYLLVLICAIYPGRQAAAIYPALALHEE